MENETKTEIIVDEYYDAILRAAKDEGQARCRELIRSGKRTQESMFMLSRETVKKMTFTRRTDEF